MKKPNRFLTLVLALFLVIGGMPSDGLSIIADTFGDVFTVEASAADVVEIDSLADWNHFALSSIMGKDSPYDGKTVRLTADLTLGDTNPYLDTDFMQMVAKGSGSYYPGDEKWKDTFSGHIGDEFYESGQGLVFPVRYFSGMFDGNGHTITLADGATFHYFSNREEQLTINYSFPGQGLFGTAVNSVIKNLVVEMEGDVYADDMSRLYTTGIPMFFVKDIHSDKYKELKAERSDLPVDQNTTFVYYSDDEYSSSGYYPHGYKSSWGAYSSNVGLLVGNSNGSELNRVAVIGDAGGDSTFYIQRPRAFANGGHGYYTGGDYVGGAHRGFAVDAQFYGGLVGSSSFGANIIKESALIDFNLAATVNNSVHYGVAVYTSPVYGGANTMFSTVLYNSSYSMDISDVVVEGGSTIAAVADTEVSPFNHYMYNDPLFTPGLYMGGIVGGANYRNGASEMADTAPSYRQYYIATIDHTVLRNHEIRGRYDSNLRNVSSFTPGRGFPYDGEYGASTIDSDSISILCGQQDEIATKLGRLDTFNLTILGVDNSYFYHENNTISGRNDGIYESSISHHSSVLPYSFMQGYSYESDSPFSHTTDSGVYMLDWLLPGEADLIVTPISGDYQYEVQTTHPLPSITDNVAVPWSLDVEVPLKGQVASPTQATFDTTAVAVTNNTKSIDSVTISDSTSTNTTYYYGAIGEDYAATDAQNPIYRLEADVTTTNIPNKEDVKIEWTVSPANAVVFFDSSNTVTATPTGSAINFRIPSVQTNVTISAVVSSVGATAKTAFFPISSFASAAGSHTITPAIGTATTIYNSASPPEVSSIQIPLTATVAGTLLKTPKPIAEWSISANASDTTVTPTPSIAANSNILTVPYKANGVLGKKVGVVVTYGSVTEELSVNIPDALPTTTSSAVLTPSGNMGVTDNAATTIAVDVKAIKDDNAKGSIVNSTPTTSYNRTHTFTMNGLTGDDKLWYYVSDQNSKPAYSAYIQATGFDDIDITARLKALTADELYLYAYIKSANSGTYSDSEVSTFTFHAKTMKETTTGYTTNVDATGGSTGSSPQIDDPDKGLVPYTTTFSDSGDENVHSMIEKINASLDPDKELATGSVRLVLTSTGTGYLGARSYGQREPEVYVRYDISGTIPPPVISPDSDEALYEGNNFTISRPPGFSLTGKETYTIEYTLVYTDFADQEITVINKATTTGALVTVDFKEELYKKVVVTATGTFSVPAEGGGSPATATSAQATATYTVDNLLDFGTPTLVIHTVNESGNPVQTPYRNDLQVTQQFKFSLNFPETRGAEANGTVYYMLNGAVAPSLDQLKSLLLVTDGNYGIGSGASTTATGSQQSYTITTGNRVFLSAVYYDDELEKFSPVATFELTVAPKPDSPAVLEDGRLLNGGIKNTYSIGEHTEIMFTLPDDFIENNPLYTKFEYVGDVKENGAVDLFETHKIEDGVGGEYIKESDYGTDSGYENGNFLFYPASSVIGNRKPTTMTTQPAISIIGELGIEEIGSQYVSYIHESSAEPSLPEIRVGEEVAGSFVSEESMAYNTRLVARAVFQGYLDSDFDASGNLIATSPREFVTYQLTYQPGAEVDISIRAPLTETTVTAITYVNHSNYSDPLVYVFQVRDQIKPVASLPETSASTTASILAGSLVILSTETPGSTIFYTDDGTEVYEPVRNYTGEFLTTPSGVEGERDLYLFKDPAAPDDPTRYLVEGSAECSTKWYDSDSSSLTAPLSSNTIFTIRARAYSPLDTLKESVESVLRFLITPLPPAEKPVLMGTETSFKLGDSVRFNPPTAGLEIFYALNNQAPIVNEVFIDAYNEYEQYLTLYGITEADMNWATWVTSHLASQNTHTAAQITELSENQTKKYNSETGIIMTPDNTTGVLTMVVNAVSYDTRAFPLYSQSENAQFVFTLTQMAAPSSIPATTAEEIATISPGAKISLTSSMSNFKIYYTLDGSSVSVPSTWGGALTGSTQLYDQTTGITMPHGDTFLVVRAIAVYLDESDPSTFRTTFADSTEVQLLFQPPAPVQAVMATPVGLKDNPPNLVQDTEVVLSTSTDDATIYYKAFASSGDYDDVWNTVSSGVENIDPSTFDIYNPESPLVISTETWIVTFAELSGVISAPTSYHYRVADQLAPPTSSHATGSVVPKGGRISLTSAGGGDIIYTLDGTDPADAEAGEDSTAMYGNNVVLNGEYGASVVVRAYAVRDGYTPSETVSFTYTILEEGSYITTSPQVDSVVRIGSNITLFTAMSGAEIYYTTNGSDPIVTITPGVNGAAATVVAGAGTMKGSTVQVTGEPGGTFIIKAKPVVAGLGDSAVSLLSYNIAEMAAAPTSSIPSGATTYFGARATLSSAEGSIHYTTNGDTPTNSSATYSSPIEITGSMVLKAITVVDGKENSEIASYIYNRAGQVSTPYTTTANGEIALGTRIELHCATEGASIYYSTNGTEPTADKLSDMFLYTEPITVRRPVTLKFFAIKNGMDVSGSNSAVYTVIEPPPPVVETDDGDLGITTTDKLVRRDAVEVEGPSFTDIVAKDTVTSIILTADEPVLEKDVAIVVNEIVPTESDKDVVEGTRAMEIARLYDINVELYGESVQPNGESEIGIPIPPEYVNAIVTIVRINDDGTVDAFLTRRDGNMAYAKVTHFSKYALAVPMGTVGTGLDDGGSSTALIIAIVAIMIVALALIAVVVYMLWRKKKKEQQAATAEGTLQSGRYNPMYHIPTQNRGYTPTPGQNLTPLSPPSPPASLMTNNTTQQGSETEEDTESSKQ